MITKYFFRLMSLLPAALLAAGCLGDNYDQPDSALYGQVIDMETGEVVLQDIGASGSVIDVLETGYANATARTLNFKTDGSYRDNNFFKGYYTVSATRANFVPVDEELIHISGETEYVFEVQPYCRISVKSLALDLEKQRINASFTVECTTTDPLAQVALFCDQSKHVSFSINNSGIRDCRVNVGRALLVPETFSIRMPLTTLDDDADYWFRIGAQAAVGGAKFNYAPAISLNIGEIIEEPEPDYNSLSDCEDLDGWNSPPVFLDFSDPRQGMACIRNDFSGGVVIFQCSLPVPVNANVSKDKGILALELYVSNVNLGDWGSGDSSIEISSSGSYDQNELAWPLRKESLNLHNGWNHLELPLGAAIATGGDIDLTAINWIRIYHTALPGGITFKLDHLRFIETE